MKTSRAYHSPIRQAQQEASHEKILQSVAYWMQHENPDQMTLDGIAQHAGLQKRTLLRHFQSKEALMQAFWIWINQRLTSKTYPETIEELIAAPSSTFAKFDEYEGIIRASLHSATGRQMRASSLQERHLAFERALSDIASHANESEKRNINAIFQLLYSAASWETLRDYASLSGKEAGEVVSWAMEILSESVRKKSLSKTQLEEKQ